MSRPQLEAVHAEEVVLASKSTSKSKSSSGKSGSKSSSKSSNHVKVRSKNTGTDSVTNSVTSLMNKSSSVGAFPRDHVSRMIDVADGKGLYCRSRNDQTCSRASHQEALSVMKMAMLMTDKQRVCSSDGLSNNNNNGGVVSQPPLSSIDTEQNQSKSRKEAAESPSSLDDSKDLLSELEFGSEPGMHFSLASNVGRTIVSNSSNRNNDADTVNVDDSVQATETLKNRSSTALIATPSNQEAREEMMVRTESMDVAYYDNYMARVYDGNVTTPTQSMTLPSLFNPHAVMGGNIIKSIADMPEMPQVAASKSNNSANSYTAAKATAGDGGSASLPLPVQLPAQTNGEANLDVTVASLSSSSDAHRVMPLLRAAIAASQTTVQTMRNNNNVSSSRDNISNSTLVVSSTSQASAPAHGAASLGKPSSVMPPIVGSGVGTKASVTPAAATMTTKLGILSDTMQSQLSVRAVIQPHCPAAAASQVTSNTSKESNTCNVARNVEPSNAGVHVQVAPAAAAVSSAKAQNSHTNLPTDVKQHSSRESSAAVPVVPALKRLPEAKQSSCVSKDCSVFLSSPVSPLASSSVPQAGNTNVNNNNVNVAVDVKEIPSSQEKARTVLHAIQVVTPTYPPLLVDPKNISTELSGRTPPTTAMQCSDDVAIASLARNRTTPMSNTPLQAVLNAAMGAATAANVASQLKSSSVGSTAQGEASNNNTHNSNLVKSSNSSSSKGENTKHAQSPLSNIISSVRCFFAGSDNPAIAIPVPRTVTPDTGLLTPNRSQPAIPMSMMTVTTRTTNSTITATSTTAMAAEHVAEAEKSILSLSSLCSTSSTAIQRRPPRPRVATPYVSATKDDDDEENEENEQQQQTMTTVRSSAAGSHSRHAHNPHAPRHGTPYIQYSSMQDEENDCDEVEDSKDDNKTSGKGNDARVEDEEDTVIQQLDSEQRQSDTMISALDGKEVRPNNDNKDNSTTIPVVVAASLSATATPTASSPAASDANAAKQSSPSLLSSSLISSPTGATANGAEAITTNTMGRTMHRSMAPSCVLTDSDDDESGGGVWNTQPRKALPTTKDSTFLLDLPPIRSILVSSTASRRPSLLSPNSSSGRFGIEKSVKAGMAAARQHAQILGRYGGVAADGADGCSARGRNTTRALNNSNSSDKNDTQANSAEVRHDTNSTCYGSCDARVVHDANAQYNNSKDSNTKDGGDDDGHGNDDTGRDGAKAADYAAREVQAMRAHLHVPDLNLSYSTFTSPGAILAQSTVLRSLDLSGSLVTSNGLRGLADVSTLRSLRLVNMRLLTSLQPLLTRGGGGGDIHDCNLEELDCHCTPLTNEGILGLERLPRLALLDLGMTAVTTVTMLARSPSLQQLTLAVTQVTTEGIAGLGRMQTLRHLNLTRSHVQSLGDLVQSTSLQTLLLCSCRITDAGIAGLEKMPALRHLDVSTTKVTDLSRLRHSPALRTLRAQWLAPRNCVDIIQARRTRAEYPSAASVPMRMTGKSGPDGGAVDGLDAGPEAGYAGLGEIPTLETLDLSFNMIHSVESLAQSTSIRALVLHRTCVGNEGMRSLAALANTLEQLTITNLTEFVEEADDEEEEEGEEEEEESESESGSDASGMSGARGLSAAIDDVSDKALGCSSGSHNNTPTSSSISSTSSKAAPPLSKLLYDVSSVVHLVQLTKLDLSFTDVYDLRMLEQLPRLRELHLVETLVTVNGLRGVEKIKTLELLDLSQTSVMSLQFLVDGAKSLQTLRIKSNRNESGITLGELHQLPCLTTLDLSDTVVVNLRSDSADSCTEVSPPGDGAKTGANPASPAHSCASPSACTNASGSRWQLFHPSSTLQHLIWRWGEREEASGAVASLPCCVNAKQLAGVSQLRQLRLLDISRTAVESLDFLKPCTMSSLRSLYLAGCHALSNESLSVFAEEPATVNRDSSTSRTFTSGDVSSNNSNASAARWGMLEELDLTNVISVTDVSALRHLPRLRQLWLERTSVTVEGLSALSAQLPSMRVLDISATAAEETVCEQILQGISCCSSSSSRNIGAFEISTSKNSNDGTSNVDDGASHTKYDAAMMETLYQFIFMAHQCVRQRRESVCDVHAESIAEVGAAAIERKKKPDKESDSTRNKSLGMSWRRLYDLSTSSSHSPKQPSSVQRKQSAILPSLTPLQFRVHQCRGVSFVSDQEVRAHLTGLSKEPSCKGH